MVELNLSVPLFSNQESILGKKGQTALSLCSFVTMYTCVSQLKADSPCKASHLMNHHLRVYYLQSSQPMQLVLKNFHLIFA